MRWVTVAFVTLMGFLGHSASAQAAPGEIVLGAGAGGSRLDYGAFRGLGPGGAALLSYGIAEQMRVEVEGSYFEYGFSGSEAPRSIEAFRLSPSLLVELDITQWVPYLGLGAGWLGISGAKKLDLLEAKAIVGLDYLYNRTWSVGVRYRAGVVVHEAFTPPLQSGLLHLRFHIDD